MFYIISFFFGASLGSFAQVVATRLNIAPIVKARSKCLSCGEALRASDLVPFLSYLWLKGKCRYCKVSFGVEALIVEAVYGVSFVLLYSTILQHQTSVVGISLYGIFYSVLFVVMGVIALYDRAHMYIPVSFLSVFSFLCFSMLTYRYYLEPSPVVLLGPVVTALPFLLLWVVTRARGVGFGDVVLFLAVGAFFGVGQGMAVLMVSVWLGALVGIGILIANRSKKLSGNRIPFVPFIMIAFLLVLFTDIDIMSIANVLVGWYH